MALSSVDTLKSLLEMCFRTNNRQLILDTLRPYCKKGKVPLLIIDDVHKAYRPEIKRFEPGILEFLQEFEVNGGQVFLLSSGSSAAYKIARSSGYKLRSRVIEMQPRSPDVIKAYIEREVNKVRKHPLRQVEIEEYCRLFNGNMQALCRLYDDKNSTFGGKLIDLLI